MAARIVADISHDSGATFVAHAAYDTFDVFYADVLKFKDGPEGTMLRVHIPGSFAVTSAQRDQINELGITLV